MVGALIVVLVLAGLVTRSKLAANHFLRVDNGNVVIYSGSPDPVFWFTLDSLAERVCIDDLAAVEPNITFTADPAAHCNALPVAALAELDRNAVREGKVRDLSLADMHERVRELNLIPMCRLPAPTPTPAPPGQPNPAPAPPATLVPLPPPTVTDGPCRGAR